jgi:histidine triad (HIT) family protein
LQEAASHDCRSGFFVVILFSNMSEKTIFQKIIDREIPSEILYEDDLIAAFRDIDPKAPVHILIVPKKAIPRVGAAVEEDQEALGRILLKAGEIAEIAGVKDSGFRLVINHGKDGGESVPHLHCHLLGGRRMSWPPG